MAHPGRFWCHCRMVYLPMSYCYGRRRACHLCLHVCCKCKCALLALLGWSPLLIRPPPVVLLR